MVCPPGASWAGIAWLPSLLRTTCASGDPCRLTISPTWPAKWQWKTQLPGVVGTNDSDSDPPIGITRMFCSGCRDAGHHGIRASAAMARDAEVEPVQVKRMLDRRGVDHAEVHRIALRKR